jgi:hypothetical protein
MSVKTSSYNPSLAKPQTWEYIEDRYSKMLGGSHFMMKKLVLHIRETGLASRLFAYTSMDRLVVSIYENIDHQKEALHITFDLNQNNWHFVYFAIPFKDPEFVRTYPADKGIEKFDKFIRMINW